MAPPGDDPAEKVQAFSELLRTTNPVLESGAADLDRLAHGLSDLESSLSLDLAALATDLERVQKEVEASGGASAKACQELTHAAEDVGATVLAGLDKGATGFESSWVQDLKEKAHALEAAFQEMKSSGWEPLHAALTSEQADFERWTQAADEALGGLVHLFDALAGDVQQAASEATAAAHELEAPPLFDAAFWNEPLSEAEKLTQEIVPWFRNAELEASKELGSTHDQLTAEIGADSDHVRAQSDLVARQLAAAVDVQAGELARTLQQAVEALAAVQIEFERSTVQAERSQGEVHELSDVAGQVPEADALLERIRAAIEATAE